MDLGFDVVEFPPCSPPAVGEIAPDFERPLVTEDGWRDASLTDLIETGPLVVCFHPMLGSFPATYTWQAIDDRSWRTRFDAAPVGITISTPYDAKRFLVEGGYGGRLVSDPANDIADAYDLVHDLDGMAGISEPRPAVFLVDESRTVRHRWVADRWPSLPPFDDLESAIAAITGAG